MIQDILPLHLQNQYEKKQPDDTSYMMIYRENKILVREGETLAFLTYRELREICETAGEMAPQSIYLFSVGECQQLGREDLVVYAHAGSSCFPW